MLAASLYPWMTAFTWLTVCNKDTEPYSIAAHLSPVYCWYRPGSVMAFSYSKTFRVVLETEASVLCMCSITTELHP